MKIILKGTQLEITPPLELYARNKIVRALETRLIGRIDQEAITADIELSRETKHHKKGMVFRAEVNVSLPQKRSLRIEEHAEDIRSAIDLAETALIKELESIKGKTVMAARRLQRKAKQNPQ